MNARTEKIRSDIAAAEAQNSEAEGLLAEYRAQLNDAKAEAGRIIEEARQAADALKRDAEARLQAELAEARTRAMDDIEAAKAHALTDLRGEVTQLAIGAAEVVVQRNLDAATQTQLVEDYINQVAAARARRSARPPRPPTPGARGDGSRRSHAGLRRGPVLGRPRRGHRRRRSRTSCSGSRRPSPGTTSCAATLTDEGDPGRRRQQIVEDLLGGKASSTTVALVSMVVGTGRASELPAIIRQLVDMSAAAANREVGEVRSAVPLTADQVDRLTKALNEATGKQVEVKVIVDPSLLGGIVAQVGDTVIDGSVRTRLEQLKNSL